MNDKIRKLYEEAKSFYLTDEYILEPSKEDCELIGEKFAELIVRECVDVADEISMDDTIGYALLEHFGVKS